MHLTVYYYESLFNIIYIKLAPRSPVTPSGPQTIFTPITNLYRLHNKTIMPSSKNLLDSGSYDHQGRTQHCSTVRQTSNSQLPKSGQTMVHESTKMAKLDKIITQAESSKMAKMDKTMMYAGSSKMDKTDKKVRFAESSKMIKIDQSKPPSAGARLPKIDRTKAQSARSRMAIMDSTATPSIYTAPRDQYMASRQMNIAALSSEEQIRQDRWASQQLRLAGVCPLGFDWLRYESGYRCAGGSHFVSHKSLALGVIVIQEFFEAMVRPGDPSFNHWQGLGSRIRARWQVW